MANIRTKHGDEVYNFIFSYYRKGTLGILGPIFPFEAATHCMELPYIFGISLLGEFHVVDEDKEVMDRFLTYLTSFMKTG
jgi:carboxylesterase type B